MDALQIFNSLEAVWWMLVGAVVFRKSRKAAAPRRRLGFASAVWFVLFGISDVAEVFTGAWWRPLWLLVWKATCLVALAVCGVMHLRRRTAS
jgi:hypothetical protein